MNLSHENMLQKSLCNLWENNKLTDIVITHGNEVLTKAHKVILGCFSSHFLTLLQEVNSEQHISSSMQEVKVDNFNKENMLTILKFLYTGFIEPNILNNLEKANSLIYDSKQLGFDFVVEYVTNFKSNDEACSNVNLSQNSTNRNVSFDKDGEELQLVTKLLSSNSQHNTSSQTDISFDDLFPKQVESFSVPEESFENESEVEISDVTADNLDYLITIKNPPNINAITAKIENIEKDTEKEIAVQRKQKGNIVKSPKKAPKKVKKLWKVTPKNSPVKMKKELAENDMEIDSNEQQSQEQEGEQRDAIVKLELQNVKSIKPEEYDADTVGDNASVTYGMEESETETLAKRKRSARMVKRKPISRDIISALKKIEKGTKQSKIDAKTFKKEDGRYQCNQCDKSFTSEQCFRKHYLAFHLKSYKYSCEYCSKVFPDSFKLKEHIRVHTGERPFECTTCGSAFKTKKHLNKHMKIHNRGERVPCDYKDCKNTFCHQDQLSRHIRQVHLKIKPFKCDHPDCDYAASEKSILKLHQQHHLPREERQGKLCNICGEEVLGANLNIHMIKHSDVWHECSLCPYKTKYKMYLESHIKRRHGVDGKGTPVEKSLKCSHCDFSTCFQHDYNFHMKKHSKVKPFNCKLCEYSTVTKSMFNAHMRTHTGSKPYVCQICGKGFPQSTHLTRHTRIHTGETPHKCAECGQGFLEKRYLERHVYSRHLGIKPYMCHVCTYTCVKKDTLKGHIRSVHGDEALPPDMRSVAKQRIKVKDLSLEKQLDILGEDGMKIVNQPEAIRRYEPRRKQMITTAAVDTSMLKVNPLDSVLLAQTLGKAFESDTIKNSTIENTGGKSVLSSGGNHLEELNSSSIKAKNGQIIAALQHANDIQPQFRIADNTSINLTQTHNTNINLPQTQFPININLQNTMVPAIISFQSTSDTKCTLPTGIEPVSNLDALDFVQASYKLQ